MLPGPRKRERRNERSGSSGHAASIVGVTWLNQGPACCRWDAHPRSIGAAWYNECGAQVSIEVTFAMPGMKRCAICVSCSAAIDAGVPTPGKATHASSGQ